MWWDGRGWQAEHFVPAEVVQRVQQRDPFATNHILHLLLTVFTAGLWAPVWLFVSVSNGNARARVEAPALRARAGLPPLPERAPRRQLFDGREPVVKKLS